MIEQGLLLAPADRQARMLLAHTYNEAGRKSEAALIAKGLLSGTHGADQYFEAAIELLGELEGTDEE